MDKVLDFEEALATVLQIANARGPITDTEHLPLLEAHGRVLAEDVLADRDQPAFDRSTRDGYAVHAADMKTEGPAILGQVRAGELWPGELAPGSAVSIMTGAPVPAGADAVAMLEHVRVDADRAHLHPGRTLSAGENIVKRGSEARAGQAILARGTRIGAAEIALAAACGYAALAVAARPGVAIVSTGDELVELSETPGPQQIRNSNSYALAAMVEHAGGVARRLPIARDLRAKVRQSVVDGRRADLLVFSGGVSMGEYDLVEEVLAEFGAEFFFTGVWMQPGKPVVFGRLPAQATGEPECFFFGLPGNPISTEVTFRCFAELFLRVLGCETGVAPRWAQATLAEAVAARPGLTRLLPCRLTGIHAHLVPWQGSGDLAANARANCFAELEPGRGYAAGEVIRLLLR